jgi:hypothetical protein
VTDLERFFERLVRNVAAIDQQKVRQPIAVAEHQDIPSPLSDQSPALGLEGTEDYEELLVRLVSGEGGLVTTVPQDVADWCKRQMSSLSPGPVGHSGPGRRDDHREPGGAGPDLRLQERLAVGTASGGATVGPEKCPHCDSLCPPTAP